MKAKEKPAGVQPAGRTRGVTVTTTTQPAYFTRTKRYRCPVHQGGKNLSVSVGYIDGRAGLSAGRVDATKRTSWPRSA